MESMAEQQHNLTILITGASSGIGKATARLFQEKGWNVIATMRSPEKETELTALPHVFCTRLDVTDMVSIAQAITAGIAQFGRLDAVLNNAGYGLVGPFESTGNEAVRKQFETNVFGVMNVTRAVLPYFRAQRRGTIVTISSMGGKLTFPLYSAYHATKWAVEGFMESLQFELRAYNIRVKLVEPGPIQTDFYGRSMDQVLTEEEGEYSDIIRRAFPRMQQAGARGTDPSVVARTIYRAVTDRRTTLRYPGDPYARMILLLRKLLPDSIFLRMMYRAIIR